MSIEKIIARVNARGLRVNNLFQVDARWQANLTDGEKFWEFGHGDDPAAALEAALAKAPEIDDVSDLA